MSMTLRVVEEGWYGGCGDNSATKFIWGCTGAHDRAVRGSFKVFGWFENDATNATRFFGFLIFERIKSLKGLKERMRLGEGEEEDLIAVMIPRQSLELLRMILLPLDLSKTTYCEAGKGE